MSAESEWPLKFENAQRAVTWADTFLNIPDIGNAIEMIKKDRVQTSRLSSTDIQEVRDEATTISVALSACGKPYDDFYRYVYGIYLDNVELSARLTLDCWSLIVKDGDEPRDRETVLSVALLVLGDKYYRARKGHKISITAMAEQVGISRGHFYEQWFPVVEVMRSHLDMYLNTADEYMNEQLIEKGVIS